MSFTFEWDDEKALENLRKHGISLLGSLDGFCRSAVSDNSRSLTFRGRRTINYPRRVGLATHLGVVHTYRGEVIRIISARNATTRERKDYERGKEQGRS